MNSSSSSSSSSSSQKQGAIVHLLEGKFDAVQETRDESHGGRL
jgi:hypothetical protein